MAITYRCPTCKEVLNHHVERQGWLVECPKCGQRIDPESASRMANYSINSRTAFGCVGGFAVGFPVGALAVTLLAPAHPLALSVVWLGVWMALVWLGYACGRRWSRQLADTVARAREQHAQRHG